MIQLRFKKSQNFVFDWIFIILIISLQPIYSKFNPLKKLYPLDDYRIQYPHIQKDIISSSTCFIISLSFPISVILIYIGVKMIIKYYSSKSNESRGQEKNKTYLNLLHVTLIGLFLSLSINQFFTDILKNWIGNPRPDFIDRCRPDRNDDGQVFGGFNSCNAPYGESVLIDGYKSTPSGHSSTSFSSLFYLTLWLFGQFKLFSGENSFSICSFFFSIIPVFVATYISLTRVHDYKHFYSDVVLGSVIGILCSSFSYFHYFKSLFSEDSHIPLTYDLNYTLPQ